MAHLQQQQHAESSSSGPSSAADVRVHVPKHHEGTDYAEETEGQLSKRASSFTLSTVKTHSRPNSWTTEQLEHVIHRKRESGDWFKLGDRFYNPTVLNGQPERPRRHPSLRHQVSRNMLAGLPVTPGGFSGFSTLDMASLARPAANRRVSTASTESFMFRPHPLQRRLTSGSQAGVATGPESKRQSCRKSVTPTAHEAVAEEEEELDTDDQTTRDYVTAASVEPASTEEDENTPGEAWLKTKAKSDAVGYAGLPLFTARTSKAHLRRATGCISLAQNCNNSGMDMDGSGYVLCLGLRGSASCRDRHIWRASHRYTFFFGISEFTVAMIYSKSPTI